MRLVGFAEAADGVFVDELVEALPVQHVEHGPGALSRAHRFHCRLIERAPIVAKARPVEGEAARGAEAAEVIDQAAAPVDHGAEHIEQERGDLVFAGHDLSSRLARGPRDHAMIRASEQAPPAANRRPPPNRSPAPGRGGAGSDRPAPGPSWPLPPARPGCRRRDHAVPWWKSPCPVPADRWSGAASGSTRWA